MKHSDVVLCADAMRNPFPVLVVSANEADHSLFDVFLGSVGYTLIHASRVADAIKILDTTPVTVVVSQKTLPDGSWAGVNITTDAPPHPPLVIVYSDTADATFWAHAFNLGAFDVLYRPLDESILLRAVNLANLRWSRTVDKAAARSSNPHSGAIPSPLIRIAQPLQLPHAPNGLQKPKAAKSVAARAPAGVSVLRPKMRAG